MSNSSGKAIILLVEGRGVGLESLQSALHKAGYQTVVAHTGRAALEISKNNALDLIIFDASCMRSSGARNCRRLRRVASGVPLIHCRAVDVPKDDSVEATQYLQRPFTSRKLLNRVRALIPADACEEETARYGPIVYYRSKSAVLTAGKRELPLTPKLAQLLELFLRHPNQVITRLELMQKVWETDYVGDTRTLDVHIRWVREHIEEDPTHPKLLRTVRGEGYIFSIEAV